MPSRSRLHATLVIALFLAGVAAQATRLFTPFGANTNFFMAGLPALALAVTPGAYALTALAAIVLLKIIPAFELSSLVLAAAAALIFFARRFPLHPFLLNPAISLAASAMFYAVVDRTFFEARGIMIAEFTASAVLSFAFTLFTTYVTTRR